MHVVYLLFMFKNDCLPYAFCSTVLAFGLGRPRTPVASKMETIVTRVNSLKSLLSLETKLYLLLGCPKTNFGQISGGQPS